LPARKSGERERIALPLTYNRPPKKKEQDGKRKIHLSRVFERSLVEKLGGRIAA